MKQKNWFSIVVVLIISFMVTGCVKFFNYGDDEDIYGEINFRIEASSNTYTIDGGLILLEFTEGSRFDVADHFVDNIIYYVVGEDECESTFTKSTNGSAYFRADKRGTVEIGARYKGVESRNTIFITTVLDVEEVTRRLDYVMDRDLSFGMEYEVEIDSNKGIDVVGADGIIEINNDGKVEIIGIGSGEVTIKEGSAVYYSGPYNVSRGGNVKVVLNALKELNVINSLEDNVINSLFAHVKELDFSLTDSLYFNFLKYFPNIEKLDSGPGDYFTYGTVGVRVEHASDSLKELDLSQTNLFSSAFFHAKEPFENVEILDLSDNRYFNTDYDNLGEMFPNVKHLDISNTNIKNLDHLEAMEDLESIDISNTPITNIDGLRSKTKLKKVVLSNVDVSFEDVAELLRYVRLEALYLDGFDDIDFPSLWDRDFSSIRELSLSNCNLDDENFIYINTMTNLEYLDISFNGYEDGDIESLLDGDELNKLSTLKIGGNLFTSVPLMNKFIDTLKVIDLSNSYYLTDISKIGEYTRVKEIVLDFCNEIDFGETNIALTSMLSQLDIEKLSIIGALESFKESQLQIIESNGNIAVRISDHGYYLPSEDDYFKGYYDSYSDFIADTKYYEDDGRHHIQLIDGVRDVIIDLRNSNEDITEYITIYVPTSINSVTIYGRENLNIKSSFFTNEDTTLYLSNYHSVSKGYGIYGDHVDIVAFYGDNGIQGGAGTSDSLDGYDGVNSDKRVNLYTYADASLTIKGGRGANGSTGESGNYASDHYMKKGGAGGNGGAGINAWIDIMSGNNITISGGNGGQGGNGGAGTNQGSLFNDNTKYGGDGGQGGNGGYGIRGLFCENIATVTGGTGGAGGEAGAGSGGLNSLAGSQGQAGSDGKSIQYDN